MSAMIDSGIGQAVLTAPKSRTPVSMADAESMLTDTQAKSSAVPVIKPISERIVDTGPALDPGVDYTAHRIPEGAETLGDAVADLPGQALDWIPDLTGPIGGLVSLISGGALNIPFYIFTAIGLYRIANGFVRRYRAATVPAPSVMYQVPTPSAPSVANYLTQAHGVVVSGIQERGDGHSVLLIPIYHSGVAGRAFQTLGNQTGLQWQRVN